MTDFNVFIVFGCMVLVLCCLVKKLLQWLWWLGSAWRELVTDMNVAVSQSTTLLSTVGGLTQSIKAQRNYPCSIYLCLWYCVCSQYLTSVGCYRLVTAFPPPLLITLNMFHQMVVLKKKRKDRGFVRAVLRSSSEPLVNGLQLLLVMWPGGDCCNKKVGGLSVCFCAV